jgi:predicted pyridoxine 5'-phosphate oxidase superfamily flavin-nucleotide-binding protein
VIVKLQMTNQNSWPATVGFHSGELAVQRQAGVQAEASRLARMVAPGELRAGMAGFVADALFAAITARDRSRRLWTSPLLGSPGFLQASGPTVLQINSALPEPDPLWGLSAGQPAAVIVMDFATRRRVRINGQLTSVTSRGLTLDVNQAFGNCPRYISERQIQDAGGDQVRGLRYQGNMLHSNDIDLVQAADTFFVGTTHPTSGNDTSHRGGPAGFVRVTPDHLWWPDFPGNNMFNSLGNLAVDAAAALLFVDFRTGDALQLSGTADVVWDVRSGGDDNSTGRRVQFAPELIVATTMTELSPTTAP